MTMTYGTMPTRTEFEGAFACECSEGWYHITLGITDSIALEGFMLSEGNWNVEGLYHACAEVIAASQDQYDTRDAESALDVVSGVIETLGFEWV